MCCLYCVAACDVGNVFVLCCIFITLPTDVLFVRWVVVGRGGLRSEPLSIRRGDTCGTSGDSIKV